MDGSRVDDEDVDGSESGGVVVVASLRAEEGAAVGGIRSLRRHVVDRSDEDELQMHAVNDY